MNDFNFDFIDGLTDFRSSGRKWHSKGLMEFCFGQIIHLCLSHLVKWPNKRIESKRFKLSLIIL